MIHVIHGTVMMNFYSRRDGTADGDSPGILAWPAFPRGAAATCDLPRTACLMIRRDKARDGADVGREA